jgi:hypothetical protein
MASILKVDTIQDQSGNNIINENADTITIGASGDTLLYVDTFRTVHLIFQRDYSKLTSNRRLTGDQLYRPSYI